MDRKHLCGFLRLACVLFLAATVQAEQTVEPSSLARHGERLVKFSGALKDRLGRPMTGVTGLTFALYKDQQGGTPLWLETQNAELDEQGRYTVLLGATHGEGLPLELFTTGEPRWLGVQVILPGVEEEPRMLLVSVPYALKAADAETLGGKPLSAFVLVPEANATAGASQAGQPSLAGAAGTAITKPPVATSGTANYIARFQDTTNLINSALFQDNSGNIGLGTTTPAPHHFVSKFTPTGAGDFQLRAESNDGPFLGLLAGAVAGTYNSLVNTYDNALIFGGTGGPGTGGLTIGPWSLGAAGLRMDGSGNVGIGTASPTQKLHVFSNSGVSRILIDSPLDQQAALAFGASGAAPSWFLYRAGNYDLKLFDTEDRVTFQAGGNVGIGTASPTQRLHVYSTDNSRILIDAPLAQQAALAFGAAGVPQWYLYREPNANDLKLFDTDVRVTFKVGGNVGIGTSTPAQKLEVAGNVLVSGGGVLTGNGSGLSNVNAALLNGQTSTAFAPATGSAAYVAKAGDTMAGTLNLPANGLVVGANQLVASGGKVGIGTASPAAVLDVEGPSATAGLTAIPVLQVVGGAGGAGAAPGSGASVTVSAGAGGYGSSLPGGAGGTVALSAGAGGGGGLVAATGGPGGPITISAGAGGQGLNTVGGNGGSLTLSPGAGGTGTSPGLFGNVFLAPSGGRVGIGTFAPGFKLDVQGGQINASGGLCMAGTCMTTWPAGGGTVTSVTAGDTSITIGGTAAAPTVAVTAGGIMTANIAAAAVGNSQLADSAVTSAKIADGTIVNADINSSAAIAASKVSGTAATLSAANSFTNPQSVSTVFGSNAITGIHTSIIGITSGVYGQSDSTTGIGVYGNASFPNTSTTYGGYFRSASIGGLGVYGLATATSGTTTGVYGQSDSISGRAVFGDASAGTGSTYGGYFRSASPGGSGVSGYASAASGGTTGVHGQSASPVGAGVFGFASATGGSNYGGYFESASAVGAGVFGFATATSGGNIGVFGATNSPSGYGVYSNGNANVNGTLTKTTGSFKIDHPLDPANKYLYHSFVESPDMMNIYNGNAMTDAQGEAGITLPDYFEALNRDFRYQLTVIGQFAQAIVGQEMHNARFTIKTDKPNVKVSWQVTGIRQDAYAEAHRIKVEEDKPQDERGLYLHPEVHGQPKEKGIAYALHSPPAPGTNNKDADRLTAAAKQGRP